MTMKPQFFVGIAALILFTAIAGLAINDQPAIAPGHPPAAGQPADVFLTDDESNNIAVFRDVSPSVVLSPTP
jgi:hypothetical protein